MLVYIDEVKVKQEKKNFIKATKQLNAFYKAVDAFLGPITIKEAKLLPVGAKTVIMDNLRKRYEFPNASDQFNLEALGIDTTNILNLHRQTSKHWTKYGYKFADGQYTIDNEQKYIEKHYSYADTPEKKDIVLLYQEITDNINDLISKGIIVDMYHLLRSFPSVFSSVKTSNNVNSTYLQIDSGRLAISMKHLNNLTPLRPASESVQESFLKLDIKPITERYKA